MKNACSAARRVGKTGSDRSTRKIATVAGGHRRELAGSLVGAILVAGCYSSSPSTDSPVPNVVDSQVLGSWQTACTSLDGVTSTRATNEFLADGRIEITTTAHRDAACVLPSFDLVRSGTYLEHTEVSLPDGGVQVSLDQVFDQNSVRPRNEEIDRFLQQHPSLRLHRLGSRRRAGHRPLRQRSGPAVHRHRGSLRDLRHREAGIEVGSSSATRSASPRGIDR